jgi:hypothetical protein
MFGSLKKIFDTPSKFFQSISGNPGDTFYGGVKQAGPGDRNDYRMGGSAEYENAMRDYYKGQAGAAQGRAGVDLDTSRMDSAMGARRADLRRELGARDMQEEAAGMYRDAAYGKGPSVAEAQMASGLKRSAEAGQNIAANMVGANPLLANAQATSTAQGAARDAVNDAAALRAREIADARAGFAGVSSDMRGMDQSRAAGNLQAGSLGLQAGQLQAGLDVDQRRLNDQMAQNYEGLLNDFNKSALQGGMAYGNSVAQTSMANANNSVQRRAQNQQGIKDLANGIGSVAGFGGMMP